MPDANGKFYLSDYIAELKARGFDGFSDADLTTFVNRGYFHIARKAPWYWEETTDTFTIAPGASSVDLWPAGGGELPYFKTLDKLFVTTAGHTARLKPMDDEEFFDHYLSQDLTSSSLRGEPTKYYVYNGKLYILRPPNASRDFRAHFHRRVAPLVNPTDQPLTPQHLDEAILTAAIIRCHKRSNEPTLAALAQADLEEFFDDMRDDEEMLMGEQQDRVRPDNTWL